MLCLLYCFHEEKKFSSLGIRNWKVQFHVPNKYDPFPKSFKNPIITKQRKKPRPTLDFLTKIVLRMRFKIEPLVFLC